MKQIKQYAIDHNVPIIQDEGLDILLSTIKKNNIKTILEIGSAIGYSTINMALLDKNIKIISLEIDPVRFDIARNNVNRFQLNDQIELHLVDALNFEIATDFDLIFIDAAKAQYIKFFEKFKNNLVKNGLIFSDNLKFHGFVENPELINSRNLKQLVRKISNYITFLKNNEEFETIFIDKGDGISISKKL